MIQDSILISSEQDAWDALELFLDNKKTDRHIEFDGWPSIDMVIKGERYSSSLPANLVTKISYLQFTLNSFYGRCVYDGDARNLKKHEKQEIELLYTIRQGSTGINADATGLLNKLGEAMTKPKTQVVAAITLCVSALIISGAVVMINDSDNQKDIEIQRYKTIEKVIEHYPELKSSFNELEKTFNDIVLSTPDASTFELGGHLIEKPRIISQALTVPLLQEELCGEYKIDSIRGYKNHYTIDFLYDDNVMIRAKINKKSINKDELKLLANSLAEETNVYITFTADKVDGEYTNAKILRVSV